MTKEMFLIYDRFKSKEDCISFLESVRWDGSPKCPKCKSSKHSPIKDKNAYHCNFCNRTFTVTTQTVFHRSKIDLQKWFYVIYIMLQHNNNVVSRSLGDYIEVTKDTAWAMQKKIKIALIKAPDLLFKIDKTLNEILCQQVK